MVVIMNTMILFRMNSIQSTKLKAYCLGCIEYKTHHFEFS